MHVNKLKRVHPKDGSILRLNFIPVRNTLCVIHTGAILHRVNNKPSLGQFRYLRGGFVEINPPRGRRVKDVVVQAVKLRHTPAT